MITFAKFQQESFANVMGHMLNGANYIDTVATNPLDDNKMITFCQIWRRDFFHFFVSILRVIYFHLIACYEKHT